MFTGIIEAVGTVERVQRGRSSVALSFAMPTSFDDVKRGDSIAVNGVCLTASTLIRTSFTADVMPETLERSSLGKLRQGSKVNLERAMPALGRFGGHFVSGHIDGTGVISKIEQDDNAIWYTVEAAPELLNSVVTKGSIAIEGVSLTVAKVSTTSLSVSVIPHTATETTLSCKRVGSVVNLETDLLGKYVAHFLKDPSARCLPTPFASDITGGEQVPKKQGTSAITPEFLIQNGF